MFDPWPRSVGWGSGTVVSCGVGHRRGSDLVLLWLWCRLEAVALVGPLAWEPPYATGSALKSKKAEKKKKIKPDSYEKKGKLQANILHKQNIGQKNLAICTERILNHDNAGLF